MQRSRLCRVISGVIVNRRVRSTVRLILSPLLAPAWIWLFIQRRFRSTRPRGSTDAAKTEAASPRRLGRGQPLFSRLAATRADSAESAVAGDVTPPPAPQEPSAPVPTISPLVITEPQLLACRPAPTLEEVSEGSDSLHLSWTVGDLTFEAFGFAKSRGDLSEDALASNLRSGAVALSDGASSSWQAGEWALHLSRFWCETEVEWTVETHEARVASIRQAFNDLSGDSDEPAAWFADEVAKRGAYAAFLGVQFRETRGPKIEYQALSVGDVCLVHVGTEGRLNSFPVTSNGDFTSQPDLISSAPGTKPLLPAAVSGRLSEREYLLMASDGVAALLLGAPELVPGLLSGTSETVHLVLATARAEDRMPDDDYTLMRIRLTRR